MKLLFANPSHAPHMYKWRCQSSTQRFNEISQKSIQELADGLKDRSEDLNNKGTKVYQFVLEIENELRGMLSLVILSRHDGIAEIGYTMDDDVQGRGVCTRAVGLLIKTIFTETKLRRLVASAACENFASWRVLEKNGFTREGLLREHYVVGSYALNYYSYGLLRHEWERSTQH